MTGSTAEVIWLLVWFMLITVAFVRSILRVRASQAANSADMATHDEPSNRVGGWRTLPLAWTGISLAGAATGASPLREFVESPNTLDGVLFAATAVLGLFALYGIWHYPAQQYL